MAYVKRMAHGLTYAEVLTLQDLADGLTVEETAKKHGVGRIAIHKRLYTARKHLGLTTDFNLLATALRRGIID